METPCQHFDNISLPEYYPHQHYLAVHTTEIKPHLWQSQHITQVLIHFERTSKWLRDSFMLLHKLIYILRFLTFPPC